VAVAGMFGVVVTVARANHYCGRVGRGGRRQLEIAVNAPTRPAGLGDLAQEQGGHAAIEEDRHAGRLCLPQGQRFFGPAAMPGQGG